MITSQDIKLIIDGLRTAESLHKNTFLFCLTKDRTVGTGNVHQTGELEKHLFVQVGRSHWKSDSLNLLIDTSDFSVKADRLVELEKWLSLQIDACDRLLDSEEKGNNDETLIAKYWFNKEAYQIVLNKINSDRHLDESAT